MHLYLVWGFKDVPFVCLDYRSPVFDFKYSTFRLSFGSVRNNKIKTRIESSIVNWFVNFLPQYWQCYKNCGIVATLISVHPPVPLLKNDEGFMTSLLSNFFEIFRT